MPHTPRALCLTAAALLLTSLPVGLVGTAHAGQVRAADPSLPHAAHGQQAIQLLGDQLDEAAALNGWSAAQLREVLRTDPTAWVDTHGRVFYKDPVSHASGSAPEPDVAEAPPFPLGDTFLLHSKAGSNLTLFIDVDGTSVSGTAWNSQEGVPAGSYPAWDPAGDGAAFSDPEKEEVQKIWQRVAEDYAPFDIDVTTQDPGLAGIERATSGDSVYGTRALVTPSLTAETAICGTPPACGGVAYINVFGEVGSSHQPAWVFPHELGPNDTKNIAEAISHEVGHNFSLQHDGRTSPAEGYYQGHNMWAPIMGVGYQKPVVQWSKGEYANANNTSQDDVALIAARAPFRTDEAGGTLVTASTSSAGTKFITSASDQDVYFLGSCTGALTLAAAPPAPPNPSPDLDIQLDLLDSAGTVVATDNPASAFVNRDQATGLSATVSTTVPAGSYFLRVDGVGNGTASTGYTDYGSIGAYALTVGGSGSCSPGSGAPGQVRNLTVTPQSGGSQSVTWQAPADVGAGVPTSYAVTLDGSPFGTVTSPSATINGLTGGSSHTVGVSATNGTGPGPASTTNFTVPVLPGVPTGLAVTSNPVAQTAHVTWNVPASDGGVPISSYDVLVDGAVATSGAGRDVTLPGFARGSTHTVAVRAVTLVGVGPQASATVSVANTPGAPTITKAKSGKPGGKKTAKVSWTAPASTGGLALTGYQVLVFKKGGTLVKTVSVAAGKTSYQAKLKSGKYKFAVVALNGAGAGPQSALSKQVTAQ